jgi:predicted benzoate:H+ symporter BenE
MHHVKWKAVLIVVALSALLGIQFEYLGWKIAELYIIDAEFPGLLTAEVIFGGLQTAAGSLLFGVIAVGVFACFSRFRSGFPRNIHKPLIAGVLLFYVLMGVTMVQGVI